MSLIHMGIDAGIPAGLYHVQTLSQYQAATAQDTDIHQLKVVNMDD